ncbi:pimeloyl-ACP methyl ester carboxylesterase [Actinoplanes tereljensis]|uniref:Alpha/beta hydrolase n=1 Tax=Paractinoplanes tereljensis TaxID=571912 RepID=A0A919TZT1_9ACTN|nr:alpha/beta fold hydrolase [Actinoplanes tereljensis]GIF26600.1 alpha/beta hydrolase [Actinoplanes tereljensis]
MKRLFYAFFAVVLILLLPAAPARAATHYSGTLDDGATWIADVPEDWNGTLVLYSHGFGTLTAADAPNPATQQALLDRGYALVGSSYDPNGSLWALASAARDQFASLSALSRLVGKPKITIALGVSMGGLISTQEAERAGHRLDAAVSTCGLLGGGVDLNNYQLDGEYALSRLLGGNVQLVDYASPAEGAAAAGQLSALATAARDTAAGRARVALGTALLNMPTWSAGQATPPTDAAGIAQAQYDWLVTTLPFIVPSRYFIELSAGGNASWNAGVNYAALLARSPYRSTVETLYRAAGLSLTADLKDLTRHASVHAEPAALRSLTRTSTVTGRLDVPMLTMHTLYDQLAPVEYENRYAQQARGPLLRQSYVNRRGHCAFVPSEFLAAIRAAEHRVRTGHWSLDLQKDALSLGLGDGPAFVGFRPGQFVSHR